MKVFISHLSLLSFLYFPVASLMISLTSFTSNHNQRRHCTFTTVISDTGSSTTLNNWHIPISTRWKSWARSIWIIHKTVIHKASSAHNSFFHTHPLTIKITEVTIQPAIVILSNRNSALSILLRKSFLNKSHISFLITLQWERCGHGGCQINSIFSKN